MRSTPIAVRATGLVASVGLSAPAACAAIRAKLTNPSETRFIDSAGEWIMAHQVSLEKPWRGIAKLAHMAAMAIEECLLEVPRSQWADIPLLLCVAEADRPGRLSGLDDQLFSEVRALTGTDFGAGSAIVARGRVSVAMALVLARELIHSRGVARVLVVASDSLLTGPTLSHYEQRERLLTPRNANGFMPGEGASALLVDRPASEHDLLCVGVGFGMEEAHIESEAPLRGDGLTHAIQAALRDAHCEMHELDFRLSDLSGEQYYFKESALALGRTLRQRKEAFDIWHPAECTGEVGALSGASLITVAEAASRKGYVPGPGMLCHMANDAGERAAVVLHRRTA